jgi:cytidylate kinase
MSSDETSAGVRMVTVSATYGSGGAVIAPRLAERLGLPFADRLILARGTEPQGAADGISSDERDQSRRRRLVDRLVMLAPGLNLPTPDAEDLRDQLRDRVATSIFDLVASGGAVVLGRAAAVVLAGRPGAFHIRLDGPPARRVKRACEFEGIDAATATDRLQETDGARARFVQRVYGRDQADATLYHLVLDSTVVTLDDGVELIELAVRRFWEHGG